MGVVFKSSRLITQSIIDLDAMTHCLADTVKSVVDALDLWKDYSI